MSSGKIGVTMNRYGVVLPRGGYLASLERRINISKERRINISKEAKKRLSWFDHYRKTCNARLTCRYFGISPQTFYRIRKYNTHNTNQITDRWCARYNQILLRNADPRHKRETKKGDCHNQGDST